MALLSCAGFAVARGFLASLFQSFLLGVWLPLTPNPLSPRGRGGFFSGSLSLALKACFGGIDPPDRFLIPAQPLTPTALVQRWAFAFAGAGAEGVEGGVGVAFHDVYGIMIVGRAPAGAGGVHVGAVGQGLVERRDIFEPAAGIRRVAIGVALLEDGGGVGIEADRFQLALAVIGDFAEGRESAGGVRPQDDPAIVGYRLNLQVAVAAGDRAVGQADREAHVPAAGHAGEGGIDAGVEVCGQGAADGDDVARLGGR